MLTNYLKISLRNLLRYKQSSLLNILSLGFGLAVCALCYLHIQYELSFDRFHKNYDQIYRLIAGNPNEGDFWVKVAAPMPEVFKNQVPGIKDYARFTNVSYNTNVLVEYEEKFFLENNFLMADASLFNIFSFQPVAGDPIKTLQDLNSIVITESIAKKIFGSTHVLGQVLTLKDEKLSFQVGAVIKDLPQQSHFQFDYLISFQNLERILGDGISQSWGMYNYFSYILTDPSADAQQIEGLIQSIHHQLPNEEQVSFESIFLQPLKDIHFQYSRGNQMPSYDKTYIYVFITIAFSLLAIACMNYVNLSIALSMRRIKEIGVRKAVGASKKQLSFQFINEGILSSLIAMVIALLILESLLPMVNQFFESSIATNYGDLQFLLFLVASVLLVGIIAGSYLAVYVNNYKTSTVLKGNLSGQGKGLKLQHALVFVQFSISAILIVCSLVISNQMTFMQEKNLGFDHDQVMTVSLSEAVTNEQVETLKSTLRQSSTVAAVASSNFTPGRANWNQTVWWEGQVDPVSMFIIEVDKDFIETMKIGLVEGDLTQIYESKGRQYLLNQAAREHIGWEAALGKAFTPFGQSQVQPVMGVVSNFNFMSLHHQIAPLVLVVSDEKRMTQVAIRVKGGNIGESIAEIESAYKTALGDLPFEYIFMDDSINVLYKSEERIQTIVSILGGLAIAFALYGVYGLISFNIENKKKEIAIRKVLGIAPKELLMLVSNTYLRLMLFAFLIAVPIIIKVMTEWLSFFSYRVDINPYYFGASFIGVIGAILIIALAKYFAMEKINPAQALRSE